MSDLRTTAHIAIHLALTLSLAPLSLGVINKTKAAFAGRVGPPLLQPYYDLLKLARKGVVISRTTSWIFLAGPCVGLVATFFASLLVPLAGHEAPLAFEGDFILLAYMLGLGRFFTIAAALDTGSAFEGMGSAREATFSCFAEPALFLGFFVLARATGSYSLSGMLGSTVTTAWSGEGSAIAAIAVSWLVVLLAENCRIPFDDPNTHLELTMIHEVMILDHSGPPYGLILYSAAMKLFIFSALVVGIVVPLGGIDPWLSWLAFIAAMFAVAVGVGVTESVMARLRLPQIPSLLSAACLISAFGAVLLVK